MFIKPYGTKQFIWQLCEILGNVIQKFNARKYHIRVPSDTKEILTILFHFSSSESFTAIGFFKSHFVLA
jgi:hypothetical protein